MGNMRCAVQVARILQGSRAALEALYLPLLCQQLAARHAELGPGGQPGTSSPGRACGNDARDSPSGVLHPGVRSSPLSEGGGVCSLQRVARIREVGPGGRPQGVSDAGDACWERDAGAEVQGALFKQLPPALLTRVRAAGAAVAAEPAPAPACKGGGACWRGRIHWACGMCVLASALTLCSLVCPHLFRLRVCFACMPACKSLPASDAVHARTRTFRYMQALGGQC